MNPNFDFTSFGALKINKMENLKLKDIEEFCAEARKLGLGDNAILNTSRQGLIGPIIGWHFTVPVVPRNQVSAE